MQLAAAYYATTASRLAGEISRLKKRLLRVSLLRLTIFILVAFSVYFHFRYPGHNWLIFTFIAVILFLLLLRVSANLASAKKLAEKLLFINDNEASMLKGGANRFDNGHAHRQGSLYADDLDIFGERSLYHFLNRTTTTHGAARLMQLLDAPFDDTQIIREQQEAIRQLSPQVQQRQWITAYGLLRDENEGGTTEIGEWITTQGRLHNTAWVQILRLLLPVFNIGALLFYLDSNNPIPIGTGVLVSWLFIGLHGKYIHGQHLLIGKKQSTLDQYSTVLREFHRTAAGSSSLLQKLSATASDGKHQIKKLSRLTSFFDQRSNLAVNFILNSLAVYDIHCMIALEKWKLTNRNRFQDWIGAVGEIEMLNSFATFAYNHPQYVYPTIAEGGPLIAATAMAHPLIPEAESVSNDFSIGRSEKMMLVTGSNMSGKSTFLRTVGINLLLAQSGAPVCAQQFTCTTMRILTSIRISDSLQEHTSYFMAELKRLRQIISELETGTPALVLIDEVLRGTNSSDKTHGSEALIRKLISHNCLAIFATHDLSLSELENIYPSLISNYCFESKIENGELLFDYRLHDGIATNKNATFLMQKMGIIST